MASTGATRINQDNIKTIISSINSTVSSVDSLVNALNTNEINKINNSWAAAEANEYITKVNEAIGRVKKVNDGLRILSSTYNKALGQTNTAQSQATGIVRSI